MRILVLGGTGSMGVPLVKQLSLNGHNSVYVTSRSNHESTLNNVTYIQGNAHDMSFLNKILVQKFDVIVDFMVYSTSELEQRYCMLLKSTRQYVFLSSSRVYADSDKSLTEDSPRLLDVVSDRDYLQTDEYALAKARQEDLLKNSGYNNWTIVRPYITYNSNRLQLGIYEKEMWLNRVLNNRSIVFQKDIASHITTMTYGEDVSNQIGNLVGNAGSYGKTFHITTRESLKWEDITSVYEKVIKKVTGINPQIYWTEDSNDISKLLSAKYQVECDRLYDRRFDNSRIDSVTGHKYNYESLEKALSKCVKDYIKSSSRKKASSIKLSAYMDIISNEHTPLSEIVGFKRKIKYIILRYTPYFKYAMHLKLE